MSQAKIPFTEDEAIEAFESWGCNCGPSALAVATKKTLDEVRPALGEFEKRGYVNPTMMLESIERCGWKVSRDMRSRKDDPQSLKRSPSQFPRRGLVRVQWTGIWNGNWREEYKRTHWIASRRIGGGDQRRDVLIFDINAFTVCGDGVVTFADWETKVVPAILDAIPNNDGGWYATHRLEVSPTT